MFKRVNKVTALLVAAASVMSVVPAMAADSTSKLDTKDGTIQHAVAFKDGKYLYEGYKSDDDDQSIYYHDGDKDKSLDDVSDADIQVSTTTDSEVKDEAYTTDGSYEDKYTFVKDGSDEYLVDLTSGTVNDDDTPSDYLDTATTKIKSALKKTDRYTTIKDYEDGTDKTSGEIAVSAVPGTKFDENTWYEYSVTSKEANASSTGKLYGFTTQNGKYIDASNLANIYAYSTAKGKFVKISEYDDYDSDNELTATLVGAPKVLAQDKDYIYAEVTVNIVDSCKKALPNGTTTGAAVGGDSDTPKDGNTITERTYIQKIAKDQGDKKDDAYLPKSVESYEVTFNKNEYDCGDAGDAYDAIDGSDKATAYSVVNGELLAIRNNGQNVKVTSIKLKKDKVKYKAAPNKEDGTTFGKTDKVDVYLAEKDDSDDVDVDDKASSQPWDIDVDGNVWVVADGKIYKFKDNTMTKVYAVDSSLNSLSVYDENNIITWEQDGDIYTTVAEGKAADTAATTDAAATAQTGWVQLADGTWNYYDAAGAKVTNNWVNPNGVWYFLKSDGIMATGWQQVGGVWYYMNTSGAMQTGWQQVGGTWYFLNASGAMQTGWVNDGGTWYYCDASGAMLSSTTVDGYTLGASGAWIQ